MNSDGMKDRLSMNIRTSSVPEKITQNDIKLLEIQKNERMPKNNGKTCHMFANKIGYYQK